VDDVCDLPSIVGWLNSPCANGDLATDFAGDFGNFGRCDRGLDGVVNSVFDVGFEGNAKISSAVN
jgi:hypothetical protein